MDRVDDYRWFAKSQLSPWYCLTLAQGLQREEALVQIVRCCSVRGWFA